jgi:hypothetical protein
MVTTGGASSNDDDDAEIASSSAESTELHAMLAHRRNHHYSNASVIPEEDELESDVEEFNPGSDDNNVTHANPGSNDSLRRLLDKIDRESRRLTSEQRALKSTLAARSADLHNVTRFVHNVISESRQGNKVRTTLFISSHVAPLKNNSIAVRGSGH